ncbi:VOC family protein [Chryseobacterium sp. MP_3.2]|uniref:VOC family protein n=1 Tax=Chryseobacterium sp. MP_3.2 TaxID=3071712 RepID=UPI002DFE7C5F|nr:hypothetical protein [Chryseobacterium sp. MP_3.2]
MNVRFARHTENIEHLITFYTSILNFEVLGNFKNHDGYDGVFLGVKGENWHLEFTQNKEKPKSKFDEDDAKVFYPKTQKSYDQISENLKEFKVPLLEPKNPYWKNKGICFEDSDHCRIIMSKENIEE